MAAREDGGREQRVDEAKEAKEQEEGSADADAEDEDEDEDGNADVDGELQATEVIGEYADEMVLGDMDYDDGAAVESSGRTTVSASPIRHALWRKQA